MVDILMDTDTLSVVGPPDVITLVTETGATGPRGSLWFTGAGMPSSLTIPDYDSLKVGDMYIDQNDGGIYQMILLPSNALDWIKVGVSAAGADAPVQSVAGRTGAVTLAVADVSGAVASTDPRLADARTPTAHAASHKTAGADALTAADIGAQPAGSYAAASHTQAASTISDSTAVGRSVLTAVDAAAARTAITEWIDVLKLYQRELGKGWHDIQIKPATPKTKEYRGTQSISQPVAA